MYTGWEIFWQKGFDVNRRLLCFDERQVQLKRVRQSGIEPDEMASLIHFNSTYADFIDRRYRLRGMVATTAFFVGLFFCFIAGVISLIFLTVDFFSDDQLSLPVYLGFVAFFSFIAFSVPLFFIRSGLRHDFFTYTHYPIRFNRKTRMVHAFQHNGPGGVISVPWEQAFFFIGEGSQQKYIRDLRCYVLDGDTIKATFVVGHYFDDTQIKRIQAMWEFIRRYMDEGADRVTDNPLDRYVDTSVNETWTNCYVHVATSMGPMLYRIRYLLFPVYGLLTLTRWLVFKSCKAPLWSPEVEAEARVEPNDPNCWPEPKYSGEFANDPKIYARILERMKQFEKH